MGTEAVVCAPNDGYTLLISGAPTHAVNPHLCKNLTCDLISDMTSILPSASLPAEATWFLAMTEQITHQSLSVKNEAIRLPDAAGYVSVVDWAHIQRLSE